MTFETIFKAWTSQITEHIKDIKEEQKRTNDAVIKSAEEMSDRIGALDKKIENVSRELLVHTTTDKVRIATISAIVGVIATAVSVAISLIKFGKDNEKPKTEITVEK